ncbi:unnamed protein product [marine sediment metagenome]|uniref:Uncharacterized protein n=1 Tax=marine sediment metagenome TaxID=412755 RepID=X1U845_9ZZZZ
MRVEKSRGKIGKILKNFATKARSHKEKAATDFTDFRIFINRRERGGKIKD